MSSASAPCSALLSPCEVIFVIADADERVSDLVIVADAHVPLLKLKFDGVDFDLTFANGLDIHGDVPMQPIGGWGADPLRSLRPNWQAEMQHDMQAYRSVNGISVLFNLTAISSNGSAQH
eukprot:SAG31_NODE_1020_length_10349_cov_5.621561_11_plen_120_part_00